MPRTSYGEGKLNQAWKLIAAIMKHQSPGVQLCQDSEGRSYLLVEASLADMATWSKLSIDRVRETLNQHLGESFLGIVIDLREREKKYGRGAKQWKFKLKLWSIDPVENQQQFEEAWMVAKYGNSSECEKPSSQISLNFPLISQLEKAPLLQLSFDKFEQVELAIKRDPVVVKKEEEVNRNIIDKLTQDKEPTKILLNAMIEVLAEHMHLPHKLVQDFIDSEPIERHLFGVKVAKLSPTAT